MDRIKLASGDNVGALPISPRFKNEIIVDSKNVEEQTVDKMENVAEVKTFHTEKLQKTEDNEEHLKDRISQCRNIIESLKFELNEEKAKLEKEVKGQHSCSPKPLETISTFPSSYYNVSTSDDLLGDLTFSTNLYGACVDGKLNCDENLIEYEKQLEKYQQTLNMAQIEKKNAIRKQMLAKAYRLKLLEVENQCNIELLRVKQSLQCLEPLQLIASKWRSEVDDASYNLDKFELMPRFPELSANSGSEVEPSKEECVETTDECVKIDSNQSDC